MIANSISALLANPDGAIFRPLKWDEQVRRGDFVEDDRQGLALWEGPSGFRADAFVKTIYRKLRPAAASRPVKVSP